MSLGGIAIAIGAMVDAAIIMIENAHKHLEHHAGTKEHWRIIADSAKEVGPTLFYALLVITVSFAPVFTLEAQEGRLFKPLAYTKTYAMAAAAGLAVTLIPVLMGYLIRGRIPAESANPINRLLIAVYRPVLDVVLRAFTGFTMAGCFMIIESWLNERATNENRGTVFGLYMMVTYASIMAGQMIV